jgi:hypothetical protein
MSARGRTEISIAQKREICQYKEENPGATQIDIATVFQRKWKTTIARRTVGDILKRKSDWESTEAYQMKTKRAKKPKFEELEHALGLWFAQMEAKKAIITDAILVAKAKEFADRLDYPSEEFKCSNGWLCRFKQRRGIASRKLHGEASSVDSLAVHSGRCDLKALLSEYSPRDVYNIDETGLFYRMPPSRSLTTGPQHGTKQYKDRVTIAFCCNADGSDKLKPFVIGKSAKPRCFNNFSPSNYVRYAHNKKAWMTFYLFGEWLYAFDNRMTNKGRKVLLLLDNVSSHFPDIELHSIRLQYLPPNTTSHLQPLDAGIIKTFKTLYRKFQVDHLIHKLEMDLPPDLNLKEAIRFLTRAWNSVTPETIYNCWKHTGIMASAVPEGESSPDPSSQLADLLAVPSMSRTHPMSAREFLSVDDELETGETLTDDDIVSLVAGSEDSEDDDDHCETEPEKTQCIPSSTEARQALSLLQVFFESRNHSAGCRLMLDTGKALDEVATKETVQTTLYSFFLLNNSLNSLLHQLFNITVLMF